MKICSFQVIYLLCLMSKGAGRDADGKGEVREIGSSGFISGRGEGQELQGLSELLPHHVHIRDEPEMPELFGADHCCFGCSLAAFIILGWSWGAAVRFPSLLLPQEPP